jgi:Zn-dependent protease with chaperone function
MISAARLYGVGLVGGLAAAALTLAAAVGSLARLPLERPSPAELWGACGQLLPAITPASVTALLLTSLAATVAFLAARSLYADIAGQRAARRVCRRSTRATIGDHEVLILPDCTPRAFCTGVLRPQIVISAGALSELAPPELAAVLAHEAHHAASRDALRLLSLRVLADALFFLPLARRLAERHSVMVEVAADSAATAAAGRSALARALLCFSSEAVGVGISGERIDALRGHSSRRDVPLGVMLGALFTLTALAALAFWHGPASRDHDAATPAANSAGQTCLLLLLALPLLIASVAFLRARPRPGRT